MASHCEATKGIASRKVGACLLQIVVEHSVCKQLHVAGKMRTSTRSDPTCTLATVMKMSTIIYMKWVRRIYMFTYYRFALRFF